MPHTPGPWLFQGDHVDDSKGLPLCKNVRSWASFNPDDFRLIAQAPAMYELLKKFHKMLVSDEALGYVTVNVHTRRKILPELAAVLKAVEGEE